MVDGLAVKGTVLLVNGLAVEGTVLVVDGLAVKGTVLLTPLVNIQNPGSSKQEEVCPRVVQKFQL